MSKFHGKSVCAIQENQFVLKVNVRRWDISLRTFQKD